MISEFVQKIVRWKYAILTYRDYHNRLNRSVDVETALWDVYHGKRGLLTPDECRKLAIKLGVPNEFQPKNETAA